MVVVSTHVGNIRESARTERVEPDGLSITAFNVQGALAQVDVAQANKQALGNSGQIVIPSLGVNFNVGNSDNQIFIQPLPTTNYLVAGVRITNANHSLTTATFGLFTGAGGTGTAIIAAGTAITVAASPNAANDSQLVTPGVAATQSFSNSSLYFRVGTAEGAAALADVLLMIVPLF